MDEMKIKLSTKLMRGIVSKLIAKMIFKKFGIKPDLKLNEIDIETIDDKICFHVNVDAKISKDDLLKAKRLKTLIEEEL